MSSDSSASKHPADKRAEVDVVVAEFFWDGPQELEFVRLEGIGSWFLFLWFEIGIYYMRELFNFGVFGELVEVLGSSEASLC